MVHCILHALASAGNLQALLRAVFANSGPHMPAHASCIASISAEYEISRPEPQDTAEDSISDIFRVFIPLKQYGKEEEDRRKTDS